MISDAAPDSGAKGEVIRTVGLKRVFTSEGVETEALRGVDLAITSGEMAAIIGPSGSGKSTLMALLGCLDRPTSGQYFLAGKETNTLTDDQLSAVRNGMIGFVFQSFNLLKRATALANVELPMIYARTPGAQRRGKATELLESVGLGHRLGHRPNQLSGGEMQRVAIARSLANDPTLILADEPTGNLDSRSGAEILAIFRRLNLERKVTVIIVTHDPAVAGQCDRTIEIRDGRVVRDSRTGAPDPYALE